MADDPDWSDYSNSEDESEEEIPTSMPLKATSKIALQLPFPRDVYSDEEEEDGREDNFPREKRLLAAAASACAFNNRILRNRRARGPFYCDVHTKTIQSVGSWVVPVVSIAEQERGKHYENIFEYQKRILKGDPQPSASTAAASSASSASSGSSASSHTSLSSATSHGGLTSPPSASGRTGAPRGRPRKYPNNTKASERPWMEGADQRKKVSKDMRRCEICNEREQHTINTEESVAQQEKQEQEKGTEKGEPTSGTTATTPASAQAPTSTATPTPTPTATAAAAGSTATATRNNNSNNNGNGTSKQKTVHVPLLTCGVCYRSFHITCITLALSTAKLALSTKWTCIDCKACDVCRGQGDEDKLLICDICDRGMHTFCCDPPLSEPPSGAFYCSHCVKTQAKSTSTPTTTSSSKEPQPPQKSQQAQQAKPTAELPPAKRVRVA